MGEDVFVKLRLIINPVIWLIFLIVVTSENFCPAFTQPNLLNAYVKDYLKSRSPVSRAVQKFGAMQDGLSPLCENIL